MPRDLRASESATKTIGRDSTGVGRWAVSPLTVPTWTWGGMHMNEDLYSSPRKEKYSKSTTGKYVVPHELISRVNPNGGKQGGIPKKESPGIVDPKSDLNGR